MFKPCLNPKIAELSKSEKGRRMNLSDLEGITVDGRKHCIWCLEPLKGRQYRWCSSDCSNSAFAWANPQQEHGLMILLVRQDWKCNICALSWKGAAMEIHMHMYRKYEMFSSGAPVFGEKFDHRLVKRLKLRCSKDQKPEVDHIQPIYKGGQSLGFDNHQAICYSCHKKKTRIDLSGKRKK